MALQETVLVDVPAESRVIFLDPDDVQKLFEWHGGQGSAVYSLASWGTSHRVSASMIDDAIGELMRDLTREKAHPGQGSKERIDELEGLIDNLEMTIVAAEEDLRMDNPVSKKRVRELYESAKASGAHLARRGATKAKEVAADATIKVGAKLKELRDRHVRHIEGETCVCGKVPGRKDNPTIRGPLDRRFGLWFKTTKNEWSKEASYSTFDEARRYGEQHEDPVMITDADLLIPGRERDEDVVWRSSGSEGHHRRDNPAGEGKLVAVRLDDSRFGAGPAEVVAYPSSVAEYNRLVTDRDGARDPRMRLWCLGHGAKAAIGSRVEAGLVPGTGLADVRPSRDRSDNPTARGLTEEQREAGEQLAIAVTSEGELYSIRKQTEELLWKKMEKGRYSKERAPQAFSYYVEAGARLLAKENNKSGEDKRAWFEQYPAAVRRVAAESIAESVEAELRIRLRERDETAETRATASPAEGGRRDNPSAGSGNCRQYKFENDRGRKWIVRILRPGDGYGLGSNLVWGDDDRGTRFAGEPGIEFFDQGSDAQLVLAGEFGMPGQFVSRYYAKTLFADEDKLRRIGLDLQGNVPEWKIDAAAMSKVFDWLHECVSSAGRRDNPTDLVGDVAAANDWSREYAMGYVDGKRDQERGVDPAVPQLETTDYAHGYWRGRKKGRDEGGRRDNPQLEGRRVILYQVTKGGDGKRHFTRVGEGTTLRDGFKIVLGARPSTATELELRAEDPKVSLLEGPFEVYAERGGRSIGDTSAMHVDGGIRVMLDTGAPIGNEIYILTKASGRRDNPVGDTYSRVVAAKKRLEEATLAARRSGETFRNTGAGLELAEAYESWMQAKAAAGDPFALSLGYVGVGSWSLERWTENHERIHGRRDNPVYPALGPAPDRKDNPTPEAVPLKLLQPQIGRQDNPIDAEAMRERDARRLAYYESIPDAQAAWTLVHGPFIPDVVAKKLVAMGYAKQGEPRRVRGGDGLPGGTITPTVLTPKGRALAKTWKGGQIHLPTDLGGRLDNPLASGCSDKVISENIRREFHKHPDMAVAQGAAIAYSHAREQGCKLPPRRRHNPTSDTQIADTILEQLGGMRTLSVMVGAKHFVALENGVQFSIGSGAKNGINKMRVVLEPDDTYDVEFWKIRGTNMKKVSEWEDVYNDDLKNLFESETGMYLTLSPRRDNPAGQTAAS